MPLLPFIQLLGVLAAVRSAELNVVNWGDLYEHDGRTYLRLHAPNKEPAILVLSPTLLEAWDVAKRWMVRWRPDPQPDDPLLVVPVEERGSLVRLDSLWLRWPLQLFYRKYFKVLGDDGEPVLHREHAGVRVPFDLSFVHYRVAAICEAARHEDNPLALKRFARHRDISTTMTYYARKTYLEYLSDVASARKSSVELMQMQMRGGVATREEVKEAKACGACVLSGAGICGDGLQGVHSCDKAADCRVCSRFKLDPDRRQYFLQDIELNERRALRAAELGLKRDAQVYEGLCILSRACIARIDSFFQAEDEMTAWGAEA